MKKKYLLYMVLLTLLFCVEGCREKSEELSCKLLVYSSSSRTYQIRFNGMDSIETKVGLMQSSVYGYMLRGYPSVGRNGVFDSVYVIKKCKLPNEKADEIINLLKKINSKTVTDTLERGVNDVFNFALYLPKQTIAFELVKTKDEAVNRLLEMLIDNSPYYVNMEANIWQGQEYEDYLIKEFGKHKLVLSKSAYE